MTLWLGPPLTVPVRLQSAILSVSPDDADTHLSIGRISTESKPIATLKISQDKREVLLRLTMGGGKLLLNKFIAY